MSLIEAIMLGALQGLTEFLPVSSSAHLALAHWLFGWRVPDELKLSFDVALHAGTLLALLLYFGREWVQLATARVDRKLAGLVVLACVPGGLAGLWFEGKAETGFRDPLRIAAMMAVAGLLMLMADRLGKQQRETAEARVTDAAAIGVLQALAIMPGVSRSGITISAGLFCGFTRESAARFSFLISMPIIAGATLWEARHFDEILHSGLGPQILAGVASASLFGYLAIDRLLRHLRTRTLAPFVVYRLAVAAMVAVVWYARGGK